MKKNVQPVQVVSRFAWHHVRGAVPADWEVSRYAMEERAGRLEFATRNGLQLTIGWEPCGREPDRLSTMAVFLAKNIIGEKEAKKRGFSGADVRTEECGRFMIGYLSDDMPLQALAYDAAGGSLLTFIFEGRSSAAERARTVRPVLETIDFNDDPGMCEYALFGVRARLPRDFRVEDFSALPACVALSLESEKSKTRATFRRWGLADMLLGPRGLEPFYAAVAAGSQMELSAPEKTEVFGCEALSYSFSAPRRFHDDRFMARRWKNGRAVVWRDAAANRIYSFEQIGPDDRPEIPVTAAEPYGATGV